MQESFLITDVDSFNKEEKDSIRAIVTTVISIINKSTLFNVADNSELEIKVGKDTVHKSIVGQEEPLVSRWTQENYDKITGALINPKSLKGFVSIFLDKERVFHARAGRVVQDSFSLTSDYPQTFLKEFGRNLLKEAKGYMLANCASYIMTILGEKNLNDNSLYLKSGNYYFIQRGKQLSVTTRDGRGEVLNQDGFTKVTTDEDKASLAKLEGLYKQLKVIRSSVQELDLKQSI